MRLFVRPQCSVISLDSSENGREHTLIRLLVALTVLPFLGYRFEICRSHCPSPWAVSLSFWWPVLKDDALRENVNNIIAVPLLPGVHNHRKLRSSRSTIGRNFWHRYEFQHKNPAGLFSILRVSGAEVWRFIFICLIPKFMQCAYQMSVELSC